MRVRLILLLCLACSFAALAADPGDAIEFGLAIGSGGWDGSRTRVVVDVSVPADQLRFVEDGVELAARFSIFSVDGGVVTRLLEEPRRVTAPRGTAPAGVVTVHVGLKVDRRATKISIVVRDENSGLSGTRSVAIHGTALVVEPLADAAAADAAWRDVLARGQKEKKPIVVFFRAIPCGRCRDFERVAVPHPTTQRRLPAVAFAILPATAGEASKAWSSAESGVALFDRSGVLRARWPIVPGTTTFGIILDSVTAVAAHFERAAQLSESGAPGAAEVEVATALARIGHTAAAHAALARARADEDVATQQAAVIAGALLDANERKSDHALADLQAVIANAASPALAADAWMATGSIHRAAGAVDAAIPAFTKAAELAAPLSAVRAAALQALNDLRPTRTPAETAAIRVLPLGHQVVTGRQLVRTHIVSAAVSRVTFALDGREMARVERPPFSATLDFGKVPERRAVAVVAYDRAGHALGRDQRIVNEAGETFWLRLIEPRAGAVAGSVHVSLNVRVPAARRVQRVAISWNAAERAVLTAAPWEAAINIPAGQVGVVRAVAELDDGRSSEDAVLLNAVGMSDESNVQLVELPITILRRDGTKPQLTADRILVREGNKTRRVESLATAEDTPLTVGLLIDASDSMHKTLADVQEAAIRFLETSLGERDRAFLITFDTGARLVQPVTHDLNALRKEIMAIRPDGLTSLHDAMVLGLLQFEGIKGRRAMIVFSDGLDITSQYTAADVGELARRVNVPVHVIASVVGVPAAINAAATTPVEALDPQLESVSRSTGGTSHRLTNLADLPLVYARIEEALRAQILAFVSTDPAVRDNEWRSVRIEVEGNDLVVYAPAGYYASW